MIIYVKIKYTLINNDFIESGRTNYSTYKKAKAAIKEYVEDFENRIDKEFEDLDTKGNILYELSISWDGYHGNVCKEKLKIKREYVY